jgi:hypothetical protein
MIEADDMDDALEEAWLRANWVESNGVSILAEPASFASIHLESVKRGASLCQE